MTDNDSRYKRRLAIEDVMKNAADEYKVRNGEMAWIKLEVYREIELYATALVNHIDAEVERRVTEKQGGPTPCHCPTGCTAQGASASSSVRSGTPA